MQPPYHITPEILKLVASVSEKLGQLNANYLDKPSPTLRKENRIQTIHASLSIEGNTLSEEQITALLEGKHVLGPAKDVQEVMNALAVYEQLRKFDPLSITSFLAAHAALMQGLVADNGKFRSKGVAIVSGKHIAHMAPPAANVPHLMKELFDYLKASSELALLKSCVFHYELEFIHPFMDGNGRMGRLWQTLILMQEYPAFEYIPFENIIHRTQADYYQALSTSDKMGNSTPFIEYMLVAIDQSLAQMLNFKGRILSAEERLRYFAETGYSPFSRKDYMRIFQNLSTATASRDLKLGVDSGLFVKEGDKTKTVYCIKKP